MEEVKFFTFYQFTKVMFFLPNICVQFSDKSMITFNWGKHFGPSYLIGISPHRFSCAGISEHHPFSLPGACILLGTFTLSDTTTIRKYSSL
jgi:hypothetical protein